MPNFYSLAHNIMKNMTDEEWKRIQSSVDYDMINGDLTHDELAILLIKLMEEKWGMQAHQPHDK